VLAILSLVAGAASGLVGAVFRVTLEKADRARDAVITAGHDRGIAGFLLICGGAAAAVALAAWLVRRFSPYASGSGIPYVEAALNEEVPPTPPGLISVKFVGGVLAIGAGLALGREGPSVQMGAAIAHIVGRVCRRGWSDLRVLLAAGAGAGRFEANIAISALGASAAAIAVARALLGDAPDFDVEPLAYVGVEALPLFVLLGIAAGLAAALYNSLLLGTLAAMDRLSHWPAEMRAAIIGAAVGALAWFVPELVGGGDDITQRTLVGGATLSALSLAFLLRFGLGAISYAAATPGGLFAPMLVLGTQLGLFFSLLCRVAFPGMAVDTTAFAVVGMAAFFTGVVQAPVTGIALVIEMTASFTMLLPMLAACFAAMLVPNLLGSAPIYESLRQRTAPTAGVPPEMPADHR